VAGGIVVTFATTGVSATASTLTIGFGVSTGFATVAGTTSFGVSIAGFGCDNTITGTFDGTSTVPVDGGNIKGAGAAATGIGAGNLAGGFGSGNTSGGRSLNSSIGFTGADTGGTAGAAIITGGNAGMAGGVGTTGATATGAGIGGKPVTGGITAEAGMISAGAGIGGRGNSGSDCAAAVATIPPASAPSSHRARIRCLTVIGNSLPGSGA